MSKIWLITGASSGLGRIMTEDLLERGDKVVATIRRKDALTDLKREYGDRLIVMMLEMTDTVAIRSAVAGAFGHVGRIDVVVSNAGYGLFGAAEEVADADIDRQIATNLTGSIQLIRAVLPYLRQQGGGRIMQVSSEGGQIAYPNFSLYHTTKWGIEGFIESVAQEVAPFRIDCIIVEPGPTGTNFAAGMVHAAPMAVYDDTPAGAVRKAIDAGTFPINGDARRTVAAMIAAADSEKPPFRLPLGSKAYDNITRELASRLTSIETQRDVAYSADGKR
ncbi:short-subunit dehydrogenase [Acetobacter aceti NBRC 14818]|uniref:Short-chain dehydrogenase/reductase n=1 Tax=Acetobacter aceti NBRC 14818 TaxID=887700 RepID=A0AB33IF78_ACEAC|nr:SDR family oxidoreductase [Acetobacter aceti]TCS31436.1 short-subunit dehydrogenase [Acetobacter aceti NBRC 14818]BCK76815.1 short-chain dehydrogenase/reductase [Acetobacter aceti NBRC 14818]GAN56918.1 oxidoreductase/short-chain dehydrogenase/reductase SDR [Acetobacter aceti NBRC 14818]